MTNAELRAIVAGLFDSLVDLKTHVRQSSLIALATKDTLANLHPNAGDIYESAYREHSTATGPIHTQIVDGWKAIADELREGSD